MPEWISSTGQCHCSAAALTELDTIQRARSWRATKYDAGFGWLSGPTEYGGGGFPPLFEAAYDQLESLFDCPEDDPFTPGLEFVGPAILQYGTDRAPASTCSLPSIGAKRSAASSSASPTPDRIWQQSEPGPPELTGSGS